MGNSVIVDAKIDEIYTNASPDCIALPDAEEMAVIAENNVILIFKREHNDVYSTAMRTRATQGLAVSYGAIQAFVIGKIVAEPVDAVKGYNADSRSTLSDALNCASALLEAAKNAQQGRRQKNGGTRKGSSVLLFPYLLQRRVAQHALGNRLAEPRLIVL